MLVFAGLFLPDGYPEVAKLVAAKAEQGVKIRLALGDPDSDAVRRRGAEEQIGEGMAARVRLGPLYLQDAISAPGSSCAFMPPRSTTRSTALMTTCWSTPTSTAPQPPTRSSCTCAACRVAGLVDHYQAPYERVWDQASGEHLPGMLAQGERR